MNGIIKSIKADVIISFIDKTNIKTIIASIGTKIPVIVSERSDPQKRHLPFLWKMFRRLIYPFADAIVVQSQGACNYFRNYEKEVWVIPNPVPVVGDSPSDCPPSLSKPIIVALGRLCWEKNHELLLRAFSSVKDRYPDWNLIVMGDGPLREKLETLSAELFLGEQVIFLGNVKNPQKILRHADLFVMTSHLEGFPNAMCEAMACGLPVISTDCPSGPREIIRHGVDGLLISENDEHALVSAMDRMMSNDDERREMGLRAREITDRFGLGKIMGQWEDLITDVTKSSKRLSSRMASMGE